MKNRTKRTIGEIISMKKNLASTWVLTIRWMPPDEDDMVADYFEHTWPWIDLLESGVLTSMIESGEVADPAGLMHGWYGC